MKCMKKRSFVNSARPRKTRFPELFLLAPLAIGCSFFPLQLATVRAEEAQQQSTSHVEQKIPPASELRELPPPEYAKLKSETLAKAKAQVSPKIRNPKAPHGGLDPAIQANLEQQKIYVQTHRHATITGPRLAWIAGSRPPCGAFGFRIYGLTWALALARVSDLSLAYSGGGNSRNSEAGGIFCSTWDVLCC